MDVLKQKFMLLKNEENRVFVKNLLFQIAWCMLLIQTFCLELIINPMGDIRFTAVIFALLLSALAVPMRYSMREILGMGIMGVCGVLISRVSQDNSALWVAVFIVFSKNIKTDALIKKMFIVLALLFVATLCAMGAGYLPDVASTNGMSEALKHGLGFSTANTCHMVFMVVVALLIAAYNDRLEVPHLCIVFLLSAVLYRWTHCKTSAAVIAIVLLLDMLFKYLEKRNCYRAVDRLQFLMNLGMFAVIIGILLIPFFYTGQSEVEHVLNRFITGRISRGFRFFGVYSIRLFGNYIPELHDASDYIDIGYWAAELEYGIVFAAAFILGEMLLLREFRKQHKLGAYLVVLAMLIHMCGERMMMRAHDNFTYLWMAQYFLWNGTAAKRRTKMKETLKVSVIVPVHNAESSLAHCINSVLSQNYGNIECILIENASVDDSKFICAKYAEENVNVIFRSLEKPGVSHARNIGLSLASGDIIGFCDADDFLEEKAIRAIVTEFIRTPQIAAVFGGFNLGTTKNNRIYKCYKGLKEQVISIERAMQLTLIHDSVMGSVWNKYYRAEFLKGIQFDEGLSMCEDMHFNILALHSIQNQFKVKILNIPLYCYMDNPNSVTHDGSNLFDENNELRYIAALKKLIRTVFWIPKCAAV